MNTAHVQRLLELLFSDVPGLIEVRSIEPDVRGARSCLCETVSQALSVIGALSDKEINIYVGSGSGHA